MLDWNYKFNSDKPLLRNGDIILLKILIITFGKR